jgi:hypothetical protein
MLEWFVLRTTARQDLWHGARARADIPSVNKDLRFLSPTPHWGRGN